MVSFHEREKLIREYKGEPACVLGLLMKCAAGLLFIVGAALIGTQADRDEQVIAGDLQAQHAAGATLKHEGRLRDERNSPFTPGQRTEAAECDERLKCGID